MDGVTFVAKKNYVVRFLSFGGICSHTELSVSPCTTLGAGTFPRHVDSGSIGTGLEVSGSLDVRERGEREVECRSKTVKGVEILLSVPKSLPGPRSGATRVCRHTREDVSSFDQSHRVPCAGPLAGGTVTRILVVRIQRRLSSSGPVPTRTVGVSPWPHLLVRRRSSVQSCRRTSSWRSGRLGCLSVSGPVLEVALSPPVPVLVSRLDGI